MNGFISKGNVHWEFINSKEIIHSYSYFETDELGNFEEFIITDEIEPDNCTIRFFDDKNNNFLKDLIDQKFY